MGRNRRIRLLCIGRDLSGGGAERVQLSLLEHIDRSKFDIDLFFLQDHGNLRHLIPSNLNSSFGVSEDKNLKLRTLSILTKLLDLAKESDLIFAMIQGTPTYIATLIGRFTNRPVVGWMHSIWTKNLLHELSWWHRPISRLIYPSVDRFIAVSYGSARDLQEFAPVLMNRVITIPNFLPLNLIKRQAEENLPEWGMEIFKRQVVLAAGRLIPAKGFDILLVSFDKLVKSGFDLNLVILGQGPEYPRLKNLAHSLGINARVFMPGFQENPYPFFKNAEMFVLSSRYEAFGMVVVEALALGTCVVATDCQSGPREVLKDGQYGVLVAPDDADALMEGMASLLNDPIESDRFRNDGKEYAWIYDVNKSVPDIEDHIYKILLKKPES
jgi:glycosyltransferase involved in cell wall biosynthesis